MGKNFYFFDNLRANHIYELFFGHSFMKRKGIFSPFGVNQLANDFWQGRRSWPPWAKGSYILIGSRGEKSAGRRLGKNKNTFNLFS